MSGNERQLEIEKDTASQSIKIRAVAKRNGLSTLIFGLLALMLSILLLALLPKSIYLLGIFALSASIVTMLIGWFKIREPQHSLELTKSHIHYHHRHGKWSVTWDNIQRIDVPKVTTGLDVLPLAMVGIKLRDYEPLLQVISPRLATNLLLEQRALLLQNNQCANGGCYNTDLIENDSYKTANGKVLKGIPAMLANRMSKLRAALGFDLFISMGELDRSSEEFVELLRQCQAQVIKQQ
ncbi:DUF2982 domain-containing protein [Aliiglaciecola sp. LCG003]|uniref:DUF2982 domain-containing protein n=1 Tax=Aliiglaciecola sp. LCG003 TaxID=3053655 RepID=UPI00257351F7|nr:DUF2982 domain-containing protein [Aliiglaciecola sp. LCG003]WJG09992.1 DUF2982 domain-containing protein [Aliiglaciecola sp. LCG003]